MPVCYEQQLKKSLEQAPPHGVYLLFGDDAYLKRQYFDKIVKKTVDRDDIFNYQTFDDTADLQDVYDAKTQLPLMQDKKLVTLCDYDFERCGDTDFNRLCSLLSEAEDACVFVMLFSGVEFDYKKSPRAKKLVAAAEKSGGVAVCISHRTTGELIRMLTAGAAKRSCKMSGDAARYLIETVSDDINILRLELDKLCAFAANGTIDNKTIDRVCVKTVEASVYDLTGEVIACNAAGALRLLDELFYKRIASQIIVYTLLSAYVDMYRVLSAQRAGVPVKSVAFEFGYGKKDFLLTRAAGNLKHFDETRLRLSFEELLDTDRQLKSFSGDDRVIIERLVIKLIYIVQKGERIDKA